MGFCRLDVVVVRVWCSGGGNCGVAAHGRSATALVLGFFFFFWLVVVGVCGHGGVVVVWVGFNDGWVGIGGWVLVVSFFAMGFDFGMGIDYGGLVVGGGKFFLDNFGGGELVFVVEF